MKKNNNPAMNLMFSKIWHKSPTLGHTL